MRRRWYLVQIDTEFTVTINPEYASNDELWCIFFTRHPDDNKKMTNAVDGVMSGIDISVVPRPMKSFMGTDFLFNHQLLLTVKKNLVVYIVVYQWSRSCYLRRSLYL